MDTSFGLRRAVRARSGGWILSLWALLFAAFAVASPAEAQKRPRQKPPAETRGEKASRRRLPPAPAVVAPPKIEIAPSARPARQAPSPASLATLWKRVVGGLASAYAARHPDRALAAARGQPGSFVLGTFGSPASLRWRDALADALAGLGRLEEVRGRRDFDALRRRLADWIQLELLLLDAQGTSTASPSSYVQRAARTLRAASDALWMTPEQRQRELAKLATAIPQHFRDARISLVSPAPDEIDLALQELVDLRELLARIAPGLPALPIPEGKVAPAMASTPENVLDAFRTWLLELRASAGGEPPRLDPDEWLRCLRLATGTSWQVGDLKARALRELARLDLEGESQRERPRRPAAEELVQQVAAAAEQAARVGLGAHILRDSLRADRLEFTTEVSERAGWRELRLRPAPEGKWIGTLALPHPAWSPARTAARRAALRLEHAAALGVRYGLAGEAYWAALMRAERDVPPMLLDDRLVREGLGLYALEWTSRIAHEANPFHANEAVTRAFARQRGREAARLLAALELHAEGVSQREAVLSFQRRTGCDEETAQAEARAALRDPLHGIAYLGLLEILALEQRLGGVAEARRTPRLVLLVLARNPGMRPSDLALESVLAGTAEDQKKAGERLEIPGPSQQELPRSR